MNSATQTGQAAVYIRVLKKWWWLPLLFSVISASITYIGTKALMKPVYGASATLNVQSDVANPLGNLPTDANQLAPWMTSAVSEQYIASRLHGPALKDPKALYRTVCTPDTTDRFVSCNTTSAYPDAAASVMNTLVRNFIPFYDRNSKRLFHSVIRGIRRKISVFGTRIKNANVAMGKLVARGEARSVRYSTLASELLTLVQNQGALEQTEATDTTQLNEISGLITVIAYPANKPDQVGPHVARNALLGVIVGLGIAAALIVFLEYMDDTFRSSDEVGSFTGLPVLGAVRRYEGPAEEMGLVAARMPRTAIAEAYRVARANLKFTNIGADVKVIVVTSARDGEGKTTTANNLATTFALSGQRVLLVDADLRRPGLTKMMSMKDSYGLSTALIDASVDPVETTEVVGLNMVPSGPIPPNPAELLGSQRMHDWIEQQVGRYDLVVFDTPPILSVADTRVLASLADGVILVLDPNLTTRRMVRQARLAIENVGARTLGIVLNRDTMRGEGYYYNYYYYERYARDEREHSRR